MVLIDLTLIAGPEKEGHAPFHTEERTITPQEGAPYVALVYHFQHTGMVGTYIDFPGHIRATDDGTDAANYPVEKLFRVPAAVIHLDRENGSGAVTGAELAAAGPPPPVGGALVINALGQRRFDQIEKRSVYLSLDAVEWILATGVHLLVSDIYESRALHGVFERLFAGGVSAVCQPVQLHRLTRPRVKLTALPARFPGVTQLPCRLLAEMD